MTYGGTFGIHLLPHHAVWNRLSATALVELAESAAAADLTCVWFASRFLSRDTMTLLGAVAARVPVSLGTLVHSPWGENPLELASSLGTIGELLPADRELRFGLGSGIRQGQWVARPRPVRFIRETVEVCRGLLQGEEVGFSDYPLVADYYHLIGRGRLSVDFTGSAPISFWILPQGPLGNRLAAEVADGIILEAGVRHDVRGLLDGTLERIVDDVDRLRRAAGNDRPVRRLLSLDVSVSGDREAARARARMHAQMSAGWRKPGSGLPAAPTDEELERHFLVGTPDEVAEQLAGCLEAAERLGCEEVVLTAPIGPDPAEAVELAGRLVVPHAIRQHRESGAESAPRTAPGSQVGADA